MRSRQSGFTLVEIAIVLVIIGLLLGGVLKGQELINSAKIKNLANDLNGVSTAVYAYQDRYRALPGDDPGAVARWTLGAADTSATPGTGKVEGAFNDNVSTTEPVIFWLHLRKAGLVSGDPTSGVQPQNAAGGVLGIQSDIGPAGTVGLGGLVACHTNVSGRLAEALDRQLDDGNPAGGSVRAWIQGTSAAPVLIGLVAAGTAITVAPSTTFVDDGTTLYTVCKTIL